MFEKILEQIKKYDSIIIIRHAKPDGDALGSQIGLKHIIEDNYPSKKVYTYGDDAGRYSFMEGSVMDCPSDEIYRQSLTIILDTAEPCLLCDEKYKLSTTTVRIDHHIYCGKFTDFEVIDTSYESCAGLIASFVRENKLSCSKAAATSIFTGMVTDSGRFRYSSTNSKTFENAAYLMSCGVEPDPIYKELYKQKFSDLIIRSKLIQTIQFTPKNVAYMYHTKEQVKELGLTTFNCSRGMVNLMSDIEGVNIWVNFTEDEEEILVEIRSNKYNVQPVAVKYNGGGHAMACGAGVKTYEEAMSLLADLESYIEE